MQMRITYDVVENFEHAQKILAARQQARKYFAPKEYHYGLRNARKCFEIPKPHTNFEKRALSFKR